MDDKLTDIFMKSFSKEVPNQGFQRMSEEILLPAG